ncbi:cbb3-type cytochrome c oxidase subunit 3 [Parvularcula sp. IMCC14364]|uniref:cbb3-type cytochrome c oxidase subunit 3 n=1 Tax=Parvularcula sp. IMCC14364 TaxID=3067902 RepID=UPI002741C0C6|nr:cbb3-type cytochrome c oxidase subunit 3 [Parvularcula sp. IMCC14364]
MYEFLSQLAQTLGLLLFVLAFLMILLYALAPSNRQKFDHAARMPLDESDDYDK